MYLLWLKWMNRRHASGSNENALSARLTPATFPFSSPDRASRTAARRLSELPHRRASIAADGAGGAGRPAGRRGPHVPSITRHATK